MVRLFVDSGIRHAEMATIALDPGNRSALLSSAQNAPATGQPGAGVGSPFVVAASEVLDNGDLGSPIRLLQWVVRPRMARSRVLSADALRSARPRTAGGWGLSTRSSEERSYEEVHCRSGHRRSGRGDSAGCGRGSGERMGRERNQGVRCWGDVNLGQGIKAGKATHPGVKMTPKAIVGSIHCAG